jgi:ankyrin repeat protein
MLEENIQDDIKEMLTISNILLDLKNSEKENVKKKIVNHIFENIKNMKIHDLICYVSKYKLSYNIKDDNGNSLLHLSCIYDNEDIFNFLLTYNLNNVNEINYVGYSVLHYIAFYSRSNMLINISLYTNKFDILTIDNNTPLHIICKKGNVNFAKLYINFSKNFVALNKDGKTPILMALESNNNDILKFLLYNKHFNVNDQIDKYKNTLLHYACKYDLDDLLDILLLDKAINTNVLNNKKEKPIFYSINNKNKYAYEKLYLFNSQNKK